MEGEERPDGTRPVDRRTFVKGAMVGAAVGAAAAGGLAGIGWLAGTRETEGYREVRYHGAEVQRGSPTRLGVPLLPIAVDGKGYVHGRAEDTRPYLICRTPSAWPGARADYAGDDYLRYALPPAAERFQDEAERRDRWWFYDRVGERVHVDHFRDVPEGEGALCSWRVAGAEQYQSFHGLLLKIPRDDIEAEGAGADALRAAMSHEHDLVAFDAACTHFCCVAGWHESDMARSYGAWEMIFCTCHAARFDPRRIATYSFDLGSDKRL